MSAGSGARIEMESARDEGIKEEDKDNGTGSHNRTKEEDDRKQGTRSHAAIKRLSLAGENNGISACV